MKRLLTIFLVLCVMCMFSTYASAKTLKMKVRVFDSQTNKPLEAVKVEIETSIDVYVQYTDQAGVSKFRIKIARNEIPAIKCTAKGYKTLEGKLERNSAGDAKIKMEVN
jgi:hypothetical protein